MLDKAEAFCQLAGQPSVGLFDRMDTDVELMRDLLFVLEGRQNSPRSTVILSVEDLAEDLGVMPETVAGSLDHLLDLDYIAGPGQDEPGFWFFHKLTRKGTQFVRATRNPADWARIKRQYGATRT